MGLRNFKIRKIEWLSVRTIGLFRMQSNINDRALSKSRKRLSQKSSIMDVQLGPKYAFENDSKYIVP